MNKNQFKQNNSSNSLAKLNEQTLSFKLSLRKQRVDSILMKRRLSNMTQTSSLTVNSLSNEIITKNEICGMLRKALSSDQHLLEQILKTILDYLQNCQDNITNRNLIINNNELISLLYQSFMSNLSSPLSTFLVTSIFLSLSYISQKISSMLLTSNVLNFIVDFAFPKISSEPKIALNIVTFIGNSILDHFSPEILSLLLNTNYIHSLSSLLSTLMSQSSHTQFDLMLVTSIVWNFYLVMNDNFDIDSELISTIINQLLFLIPLYKKKIENLDDFHILLNILFSLSKKDFFAIKILTNNGINLLASLFEYIYLENNSDVVILDSEAIYLSLLTISNLFSLSDKEIFENYDKCITNVLSVLIKRHRIHNANDVQVKTAILKLLGNISSQSQISDVRDFFINEQNIKILLKYYMHKEIVSDFIFIIENIFFVHDREVIEKFISNDIFGILNKFILPFVNEEILNLLSFAVEAENRLHSNFIIKSMARSAIGDSLRSLLSQSSNEAQEQKIEFIIKSIENVN